MNLNIDTIFHVLFLLINGMILGYYIKLDNEFINYNK